jgi:hypothetical protein
MDVIGLMIGLRVVLGHSSVSLSSLFVLEKRSAWNIDSWELRISSEESIRCIKEDFRRILLHWGRVGVWGEEFGTEERGGRLNSGDTKASSSCDGSMVSIFTMPSAHVRGYNYLAHCFYFLEQCVINKIGRRIGNLAADEKYGGSLPDTERRRKLSSRKLYSLLDKTMEIWLVELYLAPH